MSSVNGFRKTGVVGSGEAMLHDGDAVSRPEHVVSSKWRAVWTGTYPTLCLRGEWRVYKNDVEVAAGGLPFQGEPADTAGDYYYWGFSPDWSEEWDTHSDGLGEDAWVDKYGDALAACLPLDDRSVDLHELYKAFQANDFRPGSCGGCI